MNYYEVRKEDWVEVFKEARRIGKEQVLSRNECMGEAIIKYATPDGRLVERRERV